MRGGRYIGFAGVGLPLAIIGGPCPPCPGSCSDPVQCAIVVVASAIRVLMGCPPC